MKNLHFSVTKVVELIKKPIVVLFGLLIFLLSSTVTIAQGSKIIWDSINESVRHNQILYESLDRLTTLTSISYFQSILGEPVYKNVFTPSRLKEYIFVDDNFFVQAVTDTSEKVLMYSVTIRKPNFYPKVPMANLWLGKSNFADVKKEFFWIYENNQGPDWILSILGAHDFTYSEGYYLANPGGYQSLVLTMTMAGYTRGEENYQPIPQNYESPTLFLSFPDQMDYEISVASSSYPQKVLDFLDSNENIVNTYSVLAPFIAPKDIAGIRDGSPYYYLFGPDQNQVRLLQYK